MRVKATNGLIVRHGSCEGVATARAGLSMPGCHGRNGFGLRSLVLIMRSGMHYDYCHE